jgi:signal transduction histidine kinase
VLGAAMFAWVARAARGARGAERRRHLVFAGGQICATLGGGGAVAGHVLAGLPLEAAAPPVLGAVLLVAYAIVSGERGRSRRLLAQALIYAVFTAALSAVGLTVFFALLPSLLPPGGSPTAWLLVVFFFAALPLDPLRTLLVERLGQRLYPDPIGTRDLVDEVDRSRARADAAEHLAEIGTLASAVAHEIRNPLGVIAAHAKLLERAGADPDSVAALRAEVDRARRFLGDLLKFSQPRPLELGAVVVADALAASITAVRHAAGDAALPPITFDATSAGAAELVIDADPAAFRDVAVVLLENAVAALAGAGAGNGAGNRNGSTGAVRVAARPAGDVTEVIVEDDGPGVPPEIEPRLFQPFVTGRGRDARHPGTGLGLATAARWLERHGGEIRHERPPAGGARFVVRWPTRSRIHG